MKNFALYFALCASLLMATAQAAGPADVTCHSGNGSVIQIFGLQTTPVNVSGLSYFDSTKVVSTHLMSAADTGDSVYVSFLDLDKVSSLSFEIGKESLNFESFSIIVHDLGSPGSLPSEQHYACGKH